MSEPSSVSWTDRLKRLFLGKALSPHDHGVFHKLALAAFFAWVGLGADGLSSTCYGPAEAYLAVGSHPHLSIFVALATAITIMALSRSEAQVMELFPTGGGGYLVASKLLNPIAGMVAGSALLVDFMLTIAISVASGTDAIFSFLPAYMLPFKQLFSVGGILLLMMMNLRGVKESIGPLIPIFMTFLLTHGIVLLYTLFDHGRDLPALVSDTARAVSDTHQEIGLMGLLLVILRAYGMGAGTYTGIEAVSSSMMIMKEPRVQTAKRTLRYMSVSLAVMATGLMIGYLLYRVAPAEGKTLNAIMLEGVTRDWPPKLAQIFILITLLSETCILLIAAQAGFLSGPRVLASMAVDRWVPTRFASLSDRLVTHNGIFLMTFGALLTLLLTGGNVGFLVVLYSINVFITFALSQLGMVRLAWSKRSDPDPVWKSRLRTNLGALSLTVFILGSMVIMKFHEGGWITIVVTGGMIVLVSLVKAYYNTTAEHLKRLDSLAEAADISDMDEPAPESVKPQYDPKAKTAIIMVSGFNGMGLHTLFAVKRLFGDVYKNYVFMQVGLIDAGNFKGAQEIQHLTQHVEHQLQRYVNFMRRRGFYAESTYRIGLDALDEISKMAPELVEKHKKAVFFAGQLAFSDDMVYSRWLHNYLVFAVQTKLHNMGIPFVILPIRVQAKSRKAAAPA